MRKHEWKRLPDPDMLRTLSLLREQCPQCGAIRGLGCKEAVRRAESLSPLIRVMKAEQERFYYVRHKDILEDCDEEQIRSLHIQ